MVVKTCGINVRASSLGTLAYVAEIISHAADGWRNPTAFEFDEKWYTKRDFSYYADKLVEAGLCERKRYHRGWYTWTTYHLVVSANEAYYMLTGIPF